tara:strand:- start:21 stop:392 length:372 start_codon:yes stop_codon:yes gene_type:complete
VGSLFGHIHLLRVLDQIISDICAHIYGRISLLLLLLLLKKKKKKKRDARVRRVRVTLRYAYRAFFIYYHQTILHIHREKREREREERGDKTVKKGRRKRTSSPMRVRDQHHHLRGTNKEREKK